jgi:manganese-dependent inorganic pyrophosphatase
MAAPIYVLGHRNPDTDSICSAVGYATLMQSQDQPEAVAARQGEIRRETAYILDRFGVPVPVLVTDVRPRVADVMTSPATTADCDASLLEIGHTLQHRGVRAVPVVDEEGRLVGVTGVEDFARGFITGLELDELDHVPLDLDNVARALEGEVLVRAPNRALRDKVMVGAMQIDSMLKRLEPNILLVIGDRENAQRAAIEFGVGALVVTGDIPVSEEILALAREHEVTVMQVPHHTYTTVRLIHLSTPVRHVMRTEVATCGPDDLVDDVREILRSGTARSLVVVDADRKVVGLISRSNLLRQVPTRVVLVDHNERGQAVDGIEEAEVIGVVDHHRVADFQTRTPPFMRLEPVGASSTIVAKLFAEANIPVPGPIAGVLLGGILADTLLFRGPTTTPEDRRVAALLAEVAGVDMEELGTCILTIASDVSDRSADQLLTADFKEFNVEANRFGIGVIETSNGATVLTRRDELLRAMEQLKERGYTTVIFAVIDLLQERTTLLVVGHPEAVAEAFEAKLIGEHTVELPGILSRKKHIVPLLTTVSRNIQG